jgi:hypothetical protein
VRGAALLPAPLSPEDVNMVLEQTLKSRKDDLVRLGEDYLVSHNLIDGCLKSLRPMAASAAKVTPFGH